MKKLIASLVLVAIGLSAASAMADTVLLHKRKPRQEFRRWQFRFDPQGSAASVYLVFAQPQCFGSSSFCDDFYPGYEIQVPGLSFDSAAAKITYDTQAGAKIDCAHVSLRRGRFGRTYWAIQPTGACQVTGTARSDLYFEAN